MRSAILGFILVLACVGTATADGRAKAEFGRAFDGLGRLEVHDLRCNGSDGQEVIRITKTRMMAKMEAISERALELADIWYEFGKLHQVRDWHDHECGAEVPTLQEIKAHFEDAVSYQNAGL